MDAFEAAAVSQVAERSTKYAELFDILPSAVAGLETLLNIEPAMNTLISAAVHAQAVELELMVYSVHRPRELFTC